MTQRVIKYRAWDGEQMLYPEDGDIIIHIDDGGLAVYQLIENDPDDEDAISDYSTKLINAEVMQFTGLLDKHGKEIYDKDILRFVGGTCNVMPCGNYGEHHTIGSLLIVKWLQSGWTLCPFSLIDATAPNLVGHVGNYDFWNHHRSFERVGDLYTTPELVDPKMIEHGNS